MGGPKGQLDCVREFFKMDYRQDLKKVRCFRPKIVANATLKSLRGRFPQPRSDAAEPPQRGPTSRYQKRTRLLGVCIGSSAQCSRRRELLGSLPS